MPPTEESAESALGTQIELASSGIAGRIAGENVAAFWQALRAAGIDNGAANAMTLTWMGAVLADDEEDACPTCG